MAMRGVCGARIEGNFPREGSCGGRRVSRRGQGGEIASKTTRISPVYGQVYLRSIRRPERIETSSRKGAAPSTLISGLFVGRSELKHLCSRDVHRPTQNLRSIRRPERIETALWAFCATRLTAEQLEDSA